MERLFSTLGYGLAVLLVRLLPRPVLLRLADLCADVVRLARPHARRAVEANLGVVLGPELSPERRSRLCRRVFRNFGHGMVDLLRLERMDPAELEQAFRVEGLEHLEEARRRSRGRVLFLTAHLGNWEWAAAWLGRRGALEGVVARRHAADFVEGIFGGCRRAFGLNVIAGPRVGLDALRWLRQGRSLAMLVDRDVEHTGVRAAFFGRMARMPRAHVSLARRSGAILLPGFVIREADGRHRLVFEAPLDPAGPGGFEVALRACLEVVERYVRRYPEQWMVFEPVWPEAA